MPMWLNDGVYYRPNYKVINYLKNNNKNNNNNDNYHYICKEDRRPCKHQREWREPWWDKEDIIAVCSKDRTQYGDKWLDWKCMEKCKFKGKEKKCNKSSYFDKHYKKYDSFDEEFYYRCLFDEENYDEFKDYLFENLFNDEDLNKDLFNDGLL